MPQLHNIPRLPDESDRAGGPAHKGAPAWWMDDHGVTVRCMCGHLIAVDGEIDERRIVKQSIRCPLDSCRWHVYARLEDWIQ